ncbi:MATE family efflux transporter [Stratiformator vulcanicus]|uniref:Multidrug-efflux transporter n=1 Tax=Stratiformator vulcanicus TaxID=2527980 RepID=A0A517R6W6_9PLAN|nr:MATE family efflux transporter [Stratiformator vulcanicus]QDT39605.1 Multidrug resistance protein NorM [Stratiformator vulcanicus]
MSSESSAFRAAEAGTLRELFRVAVPLVLSSGSLSLAHVIDRIMLTWHSPDALAASTPAGMLHWTMMSLFIGTATTVNTFVAQYDGAGDRRRASEATWQGVYLALLAGLPLLIAVPLAPYVFAWADHAPEVQRLENAYFSVLCFGAVPMTLATALSGYYSGIGATRIVLLVNVILSIANLAFDAVLIFGLGPFPELGIRGAAVATIISYLIAVGLYLALLLRRTERMDYQFWNCWKFDPELFRRLLRYGFPTGVNYLADTAGFTLFLILLGRLGPVAQQATNLSFNVNGLVFVPLMGVSTAVSTIVGRRIGEGRPGLAVRSTWLAFGCAMVWNVVFMAIILLVPDVVISLYAAGSTPEEFAPVRETAIVLLRYVAVFLTFDAMSVVFSGAIRGAGDTRFAMAWSLVTCWSLMVLPVLAADWYGNLSLHFCWSAVIAYISICGVGMLWRFLGGRWQTMRVTEDREVVLTVWDEREDPSETNDRGAYPDAIPTSSNAS